TVSPFDIWIVLFVSLSLFLNALSMCACRKCCLECIGALNLKRLWYLGFALFIIYITLDAIPASLMYLSTISLAIAPFTSVPTARFTSVTRIAALSSNLMRMPLALLIGLFWRIMM